MNAPLPVAVTGAPNADFSEIAAALVVDKRSVERRSIKESWPFDEIAVRGGKKRLFPVATLPADVRQAVQAKRIDAIIVSSAAATPSATALPAPAGLLIPAQAAHVLTDQQRAERDARRAVLAAIRNLQANSGCSQEAAMTTLLTTAKAGRLEPQLDALLRKARDPRGRAGDGYPSIRTLKRWLKAPDLAPKIAHQEMTVPAWAPALMRLYSQPQKPSLAWCVEELPRHLEAGVTAPNYDAARRFLDKLGAITKQRGRMLPRQLKTLRPFIRRDASELLPGDIYTADGHTFDAEVSHPDHGRAFRPELTGVLDIATRKCVGWSAGLAESTWAVMDAQRHAFETSGVCARWYVDNGGGYRNAMQSDEVAGFAARCGYEIAHSLPYNSQARGIMERSHKSIWVRGAKTLPTYIGAPMDAEAKNKVFKLTRAHIKATGASPLLMTWDDFLQWCQKQVDAYNNRSHRGLTKWRDPETGKLRHMTPNEAWQKAVDEGFEPVMLTDAERVDLFRPEKICTVLRGEIRFRNNLYFSHDLEEFHGDKVRVGYDIHNGERVWVRDMEGRLLCVAEFEANKRAYYAQSVIQQDRVKRAAARERRLEMHLQEVRDELNAPALLEHQASIVIPVQMPAADPCLSDSDGYEAQRSLSSTDETQGANVLTLPSAEARPYFTNDPDQYRWLMRNPAQWAAEDALWLLDYVACEDYADLAERYAFQGVAWSNDDEQRARGVMEGFEVAAG